MTRRDLFRLWDERDKRYALPRKASLSDEDVAAIRAYRLRETELLTADQDRQVAIARLSTWRSPIWIHF